VIDDAVDAIIEKVLETGGRVVFLEGGSLAKLQRIALISLKEVKQKCCGL